MNRTLLEIIMGLTRESEPPAQHRASYRVNIKGIGQISPGPGDDQGSTQLSGDRLHLRVVPPGWVARLTWKELR